MTRDDIIKLITSEELKREDYVIIKDSFDNYTTGYLSDVNLLSENVYLSPTNKFPKLKSISFANIERITKSCDKEPLFETSSEVKIFRDPSIVITSQIRDSLSDIREAFIGRDVRIHSKLGEEYTAILEDVKLHGIEVLHENNKYSIEPIFKLIFKDHSVFSSTISKLVIGGDNIG